MTKIAFVCAFFALLTQLLGFIREVIVANYYGASFITDAYIISIVSPTIIIGFISSGLASVFVPKYMKISNIDSVNETRQYTINLLFSSLLIAVVIAVICYFNVDLIIKVFATGFDVKAYEISKKFLYITICTIPLILLNVIYSGYLQVNNKYIYSSFVTIPANVISIFFVFLSFNNIIFLPIGYAVGLCVQIIFFNYKAHNLGLFNTISFPKVDNEIKDSYRLAIPVILGVSLNQINFIVDRMMASTTGEGGVSIINYASRINSIVEVIIITTLISIFYPKLSKYAENNKGTFQALFLEIIILLLVLTIPITFIFHEYSLNIINILFSHGNFDTDSLNLTAKILAIYSITIPFVGIRTVLVRSFYSYSNTKIPTYISVFGVSINIVLNIFLVSNYGLFGLVFSTLISVLVSTVLLIVFFKKYNYIDLKFSKIILLAIIPVIICFFCNYISNNVSFVVYDSFILKILIFFFFYFIFVLLFLFLLRKFNIINKNMIILNKVPL
ncbi:murein biosynthesis integral membrane protein MurJ [Photobacterium damselae]|uniref:murein biosynthesis integral membrane protein MurJ n=1 Tax=Photobacterium damselae TaxID=38293 RepID=UPI00083A3AA4|nr:murein biosynthesis integral membrane protein MurJ [Photobacterium damselae]ODA22638.1 murein biosynthesis integral membrane protein MurJ [Photobacterium damselae subsp. damselae]